MVEMIKGKSPFEESGVFPTHNVSKSSLVLRALGLSNLAKDVKTNEIYSVQYIDIDKHSGIDKLKLRLLLSKLFPYDCVVYETKQGFHFISFSVLKGTRITKARSLEVVKLMGHQDYFSRRRELCLRVSSKWDKDYNIISHKPFFRAVLRKPINSNLLLSLGHFRFYVKYMGLPVEVFNSYKNCRFLQTKIKINHYKTRD